MTISGTFRCPRPLNRGVRLIKVSFKVNKGNKFWDFGYCPLNGGCPLNTGFTVIANATLRLHFRSVSCHAKLFVRQLHAFPASC